MWLAVVGGRDFGDYERLSRVIDKVRGVYQIDRIVSGGAKGADSLGKRYADEKGIPTRIIIPDWDRLGKRAGFVRNQKIVQLADVMVAFWDGESKGTKHSIDLARQNDIPVKIVKY